MQFEPEGSWDRPGFRAFGRVDGGAIIGTCHLSYKGSVSFLSVFYGDKSHLRDGYIILYIVSSSHLIFLQTSHNNV